MIAVFAAFYSRNLSSDTKRAKLARAMRGEFNGSVAPFGYELVTHKAATPERPRGLYPTPELAGVVVRAFECYATGKYSDRTLAEWLNRQPAVQAFCEANNRRPPGKAMVRDLLQNRTYTGRVPYTETIYKGASLGQGRASKRHRREWFEGKHEAIIGDDLFEAVQVARANLHRTRKTKGQARTYILSDQVYCAHCMARDSENVDKPYYAKMRVAWHKRDEVGYFRCVSRDRGYGKCEQPYVSEEDILTQLIQILSSLKLPDEAMTRIDEAVKSRERNEQALAELAELEAKQERIQFSWEAGQLTPEQYIAKSSAVERAIASMRPLDYDKLEEAADLITHFPTYLEQCAELDEPREARQQLMAKIIDRIFIYNQNVIAVALYSDFGVVLDVPDAAPSDILTAVAENQKRYTSDEVYPVRGRRDSNPRSPA